MTTTTDTGHTTPDWTELAAALADQLVATGDLHDPAWAAAIVATPRHLLVPTAHQQQPDGSWATLDTGGRDLPLAYSTTTLVTRIDHSSLAVSSSTKPDLMIRMLELLDLHDGHRVLEIGTGTGYNAALLSHRLGADLVYSVDVDAALVDTARTRLAAIGHHPHLATRDGAEGWPEHGPYDRIIATCSVPRIPWAWAEQVTPGAVVLADMKIGTAGNLVLLHRHPDRLEGRFTDRWAAFMPMRHHTQSHSAASPPRADQEREHHTTAPAQPWNTHREMWLLAGLELPLGLRHGYTFDPVTRTPSAATLTAPDGSWCEIELGPADGTVRRVREGGPTMLWCHVEDAWRTWQGAGGPDWRRFGLTVTPESHKLWLDEPHNTLADVPDCTGPHDQT